VTFNEIMTISTSLTLETLNKEALALLINGLTSLEGSLRALEEPLPEQIDQIKGVLRQRIEKLDKPPQETMTTKEVAEQLDCTERYVLSLGKKGKIVQIRTGRRGRGSSGTYSTDSVLAYKADPQSNTASVEASSSAV